VPEWYGLDRCHEMRVRPNHGSRFVGLNSPNNKYHSHTNSLPPVTFVQKVRKTYQKRAGFNLTGGSEGKMCLEL